MKSSQHIIIAGGKTGGHLFPGIATAQALQEIDPDVRILFVGTDAPFETNTLARYNFDHRSIVSRPIKGGSFLAKACASTLVLISIIQAMYIILRFRTDFILGVGGFSSFALVVAGRMLFRRTAIQEQNAIPGMTNRILSKIAETIFISFDPTQGMPLNHKTILSGNPIRKSEGTAPLKETPPLTLPDATEFLILVTGGSQGATSINTAFMDAVDMMEDTNSLFIVHQTGRQDIEIVSKFYTERHLNADARPFFHDMPAIQRRADLVISRAGAGAVSELSIHGKPTILIPFPHAADDHQTANAKTFADKGGAVMISDKDLNGKTLYKEIQALRTDAAKRKEMGNTMKSLARPNGARRIAKHILGLPPTSVFQTDKGDI
ncbi:MAG: undecaprenyldiphospho-muramoylpentapeptide beta-N-acetylglucosaminyltransferase [Desulfobacterales bacterium]|nr:MAG: undecaprenyldiphospho-muramoylpentapeptide beta-N-acetylglucosaminyltransferase [Desulfobacterales bacterium]